MVKKLITTLGDRLRQIRKAQGLSQSQMAEKLGMARRSYGLYELNKTTPNAEKLKILVDAFDISAHWLLQGEELEVNATKNSSMRNGDHSLRVLGMAECGLSGWYEQTGPMALRVACPPDVEYTNAFAVIATGTSLLPEGIKPGYVCICDPTTEPESGDVIYIRDENNRAALKIFRSQRDDWLHIEGYLPPDQLNSQRIYTEKKAVSEIKLLATVIYVKRRM